MFRDREPRGSFVVPLVVPFLLPLDREIPTERTVKTRLYVMAFARFTRESPSLGFQNSFSRNFTFFTLLIAVALNAPVLSLFVRQSA